MKKILQNIVSLIVLIIIVLAIKTVIDLNILPNKYLIAFISIDTILYLLALFLYNRKKILPIIFGIILFLIIVIGNIFIYYYVGKTNEYIDGNFAITTYKVKTKYYLLTSINNPIETKEEISNDTNITYYKYSRAIDLAIKKLGNYTYNETDNIYDTLIQLYNNNSNGYLLISSSDYLFVEEASNEINIEQYKRIYEFEVIEEKSINEETKDSYNVYINGLDYSGQRRDFNMIATINIKTHKVVLTSIPRDFYIDVPAYGFKDSLTALGTVDPEITKEALESLFNTKIDYVLNLYTDSLVKVVDTIGGIEFCSDSNFYTTHDMNVGSYEDKGEKLYVTKGCKEYNGKEILAIARERINVVGGDRKRQENCRKILISIAKKLMSLTTLTNYNETLKSFEGIYTSNINKKTITNLIKSFVDNPSFEIIEQSVDGVDGKGIGRLGTMVIWTLEPKMDTVDTASQKINEILGEK